MIVYLEYIMDVGDYIQKCDEIVLRYFPGEVLHSGCFFLDGTRDMCIEVDMTIAECDPAYAGLYGELDLRSFSLAVLGAEEKEAMLEELEARLGQPKNQQS